MSKYLDKTGVQHYTEKIQDGTIVAGKAKAVPASGIEGVIDISHIPQGALERVVKVTDETARYKLTTDNVQLGDTVMQTSDGLMFIVIDESNLGNASGYQAYSAGSATYAKSAGTATTATTAGTADKVAHALTLYYGDNSTAAAYNGSADKSVILSTLNNLIPTVGSSDIMTVTKGMAFIDNGTNSGDAKKDILFAFTSEDGKTAVQVKFDYNAGVWKTRSFTAGSALEPAWVDLTDVPNSVSLASGLYKITVSGGRVTGGAAVTKADITALGIPSDNTHYTTKMVAGGTNSTSNAATQNPYINLFDDSTLRSTLRLIGSGSVTVKADASGNITITGADGVGTVYTDQVDSFGKGVGILVNTASTNTTIAPTETGVIVAYGSGTAGYYQSKFEGGKWYSRSKAALAGSEWSSWANIDTGTTDSALTNDEIDAAIAAAK